MEMKSLLITSLFIATTLVAEERTVWNGLARAVKWDAAAGTTATADGAALRLHTTNDFGWATTEETFPATDTTRIDLDVKHVANGKLKVQIEWFREDGTFVSATEIRSKSAALSELQPAGERAGRFRFKFWLEGKGAEAQFAKALITTAQAWRKTGTKLLATFDANAKLESNSGMIVQPEDGVLTMRLEPDAEYASFYFEDKIVYDPKATVLVDIAAIKGGSVTVQALCWSPTGEFQKAVDLVKDMTTAGYTEVPVAMHKDEFPADTAKLSFKIWLSGREGTARFTVLRYGVQP